MWVTLGRARTAAVVGGAGGGVAQPRTITFAARVSGLSRVAVQKILARMGEQAATFRRRDPNPE